MDEPKKSERAAWNRPQNYPADAFGPAEEKLTIWNVLILWSHIMKIDVITVSGSPEGVIPTEVEWPGVGGAELMLLRWAEHMHNRGHQIRVYNNPRQHYRDNNLEFLPKDAYQPADDRDVLITFRGFNNWQKNMVATSKYKLHIGWSTDQYTEGNYPDWYNSAKFIIGISQFHKRDHLTRYGPLAEKMSVIDIGADPLEYNNDVPEKKPQQFIFCSVPDRGLAHMAHLWPKIKARYTQAKLLITSDYGLWTNGRVAGNEQYRQMFFGMPGIAFLGRIPRSELIRHQLESEIQIYPCNYDELFCIANQESQMAGCYTVTSSVGALETTNFTGFKCNVNPNNNLGLFELEAMMAIDEWYKIPAVDRERQHRYIAADAKYRFGWGEICKQWETELNRGITDV